MAAREEGSQRFRQGGADLQPYTGGQTHEGPGSTMQKSVHKIRFFARTNAAPSHHYGRTIIGADDRITGIHKSTIAVATGLMSIGASKTLAIPLSFGR